MYVFRRDIEGSVGYGEPCTEAGSGCIQEIYWVGSQQDKGRMCKK